MATAAIDVPLAHPADLAKLFPSDVGQVAAGAIPVWNGTGWSCIGPGSDGQVLVADSAQALGVKYAALPGSATPVADGGVDRRDLRSASWAPPTAISETTDRWGRAETFSLTSGTLLLNGGCVLPRGQQVLGIAFRAVAAPATPLNQWFCLVDQAGNVLAKTVDDTTTPWAANTVKALALTAPYTPSVDKPAYLGIVVVASTMPSLHSNTSLTGVTGIAPYTMAEADTGLTTPASLGATVGAMTPKANTPGWGYPYGN